MRLAASAVLATVLIGIVSLAAPTTAEEVGLDLHVAGESPLSNSLGHPVLVAGIWHDLAVTLPSATQSSLTLEASARDASGQDMTSYYRWVRSEANDTWSDPLYGTFVLPSLSSSDGSVAQFRLGVDASALPGDWDLRIVQDGTLLALETLEVREPLVDFGISAADFTFRVEPFEPAVVSSEDLSQYLRIINNGNVPLELNVSFDILQSRLEVTNPVDVAHLGEDVRYYLRLNLDPRPPQMISVQALAHVNSLYIIPSPGSSQIIPSFESPFDVEVIVGRTGYQVETLGNVIFQTLQELRADHNALVTWQVFLTGSQQVSLDVLVDKATLVSVTQGQEELIPPVVLSPTAEAELALTLQVKANVPDTRAEVTFVLRLLGTEDQRTFVTTIVVGPRAPAGFQASYLWLFASLISASILAVVSYNHWKYGGLALPPSRRLSQGKSARKSRPSPSSKHSEGKRSKGEKKSKKGQSKRAGKPRKPESPPAEETEGSLEAATEQEEEA